MNKTICFLCTLIFLFGCASMEWVHATKPKQALYAEKLACEDFATEMAWKRYPQPGPVNINNTKINTTVQTGSVSGSTYGNSNTNTNELPRDPNEASREYYRQGRLKDCMNNKGWFLQKVENN